MHLLNFFRQISPTYRRADDTVAICPTNLSGLAVLVIYYQTAPVSPGGDEGVRTPGLRLAKAALSQLSYIPRCPEVGLSGLEPETSPLSEARSNQLS